MATPKQNALLLQQEFIEAGFEFDIIKPFTFFVPERFYFKAVDSSCIQERVVDSMKNGVLCHVSLEDDDLTPVLPLLLVDADVVYEIPVGRLSYFERYPKPKELMFITQHTRSHQDIIDNIKLQAEMPV